MNAFTAAKMFRGYKDVSELQERLYGCQHLLDGNQRHAFHAGCVGAVRFQAGRARDSRAEDDVLLAVRAGECGIGRAEDGDDGGADRGGDVHRAAVVGNQQGAAAVEFGQLGEIGFACEVEASLRQTANPIRLGG